MRSGVVKATAHGQAVHHDLKHAHAVVHFVLDLEKILEDQVGGDVASATGGGLLRGGSVANGIQAGLQIVAGHERLGAGDEVNLESDPIDGGELEDVGVGVGLLCFHNEETLAHCVTARKRNLAQRVKYFSPLNAAVDARRDEPPNQTAS